MTHRFTLKAGEDNVRLARGHGSIPLRLLSDVEVEAGAPEGFCRADNPITWLDANDAWADEGQNQEADPMCSVNHSLVF